MISLDDIRSARKRIADHIQVTPVAYDDRLKVWFKWENHQVTHSFKPRGALNKVVSLSRAELDRGLIACSAGNHGQGVALASRQTGAQVQVYVPEDAAQIKIDKMRALGAEVVKVPGLYGDAEAAAIRAARDLGKTYVSPYNDPLVIAGAGTVALEWLEQSPDVDTLLVPVGGGGLIAGVGSAAKGVRPDVKIVGVQSDASAYLHAEFYRRDMSH
ncbi:MAG: pyridoxal-phosphate dependent enzyme, partial [Chloroflexi bacterium]|nr:pyridoxal-phosphate dependent enzyme [Chloroflexota bacterium]